MVEGWPFHISHNPKTRYQTKSCKASLFKLRGLRSKVFQSMYRLSLVCLLWKHSNRPVYSLCQIRKCSRILSPDEEYSCREELEDLLLFVLKHFRFLVRKSRFFYVCVSLFFSRHLLMKLVTL